MSRSNNTEQSRNPSQRWFEWAGGQDGGHVRYYDKETEKQVIVPGKFQFLLLDELATVKGWHDSSESGIFANEVRDTRQDVLVVKAFKGGELASGIYPTIRDRIKAQGGHFHASCYVAFKDGDELKIGNIGLKGASMAAWMDFKKACPIKKGADGKNIKAYFSDAVRIDGFKDGQKGGTKFRTPVFSLAPVSEGTNQQAVTLDAELQQFLAGYLSKTRTEQAQISRPEAGVAPQPSQAREDIGPAPSGNPDTDFDSDIPW